MQPFVRGVVDAVLLPLLLLDALLLALLEVFFLPLRLDGRLLPNLAAFPAPVAIVVAALTTPLLVSQAARWSDTMGMPRGIASIPLVLWALTVIGVGFLGPGGDQVLVADWRSLLLLAAGALPAAFVLGRVLGRTQERSTEGDTGGAGDF